jgi:hypothetical protein
MNKRKLDAYLLMYDLKQFIYGQEFLDAEGKIAYRFPEEPPLYVALNDTNAEKEKVKASKQKVEDYRSKKGHAWMVMMHCVGNEFSSIISNQMDEQMDSKAVMEKLFEVFDMTIYDNNRIKLNQDLNDLKLKEDSPDSDSVKNFNDFTEQFEFLVEMLSKDNNGQPFYQDKDKRAQFINKLTMKLHDIAATINLLPDMTYLKLVDTLRSQLYQKIHKQTNDNNNISSTNNLNNSLHQVSNYTSSDNNNRLNRNSSGRFNNRRNNYNPNYTNNSTTQSHSRFSPHYQNNDRNRNGRFNNNSGRGRGHNNKFTNNRASKLQHVVQNMVHNVIRETNNNNNNNNNNVNSNKNDNNNNTIKDDYKNINNNNNSQHKNKNCYKCGLQGHIAKYCPDQTSSHNSYNRKGSKRFSNAFSTIDNMNLNTGCNDITCMITEQDFPSETVSHHALHSSAYIGPTMFIVDTGSSKSHCNDKTIFNIDTIHKQKLIIQVADGNTQYTEAVGKINNAEHTIGDVYYTPMFKCSLLSADYMTKIGYDIIFKSDKVIFTDGKTGDIKAEGIKHGSLFYVDVLKIKPLYVYDQIATGRQ